MEGKYGVEDGILSGMWGKLQGCAEGGRNQIGTA